MEDDNGLSLPLIDALPACLRVLVVDDDPIWLNILKRMLQKCSYEVTTCCSAKDALDKLRERKHVYDIIITDVNMPDMDGFKLLQHIKRQTDLPVILMSVDGKASRVMKGIRLGACDYLVKPVRMKELRNIWQHVNRRKIQEVRGDENKEGMAYQITGNGIGSFNGEQFQSKHKSGESWIIDLQQKVFPAVNQIGPDGKENDHRVSPNGIKYSDSASRDSTASVGTQHSCNGEYIAVLTGSCGLSGNSVLLRKVESKSDESDEEGIASMPVADSRMSSSTDVSDPSSSRSHFSHSSTSSGSGANSFAFDSTFLFTLAPDN